MNCDRMIIYYDSQKGSVVNGRLYYHIIENNIKSYRVRYIHSYEIEKYKQLIANQYSKDIDEIRFSPLIVYKDINNVANNDVMNHNSKVKIKDLKIYKKSIVNFQVTKNKINYEEEINNCLERLISILVKIFEKDYDELEEDDVQFLEKMFQNFVTINNNDYNNTINNKMSELLLSFSNEISREVFNQFQKLYNNIWNSIASSYEEFMKSINSFLVYSMTLINGGENKERNGKYKCATFKDAFGYINLPDVFKIKMLFQIKNVLYGNDISFENLEQVLYSFDSKNFDRREFLKEIDEKIRKVESNIYKMIEKKVQK